jgi:hypothetical protein
MTSFIDVPTWHGEQRALEKLLFSFYVHFINKGCQWFFTRFRPPLPLHWAIVVKVEVFSKFNILPNFLPISLHNLFHATSDGFKS